MTKARRGVVFGLGFDFGFGFDSHDLTTHLSSSSKPMYWNVRLWLELTGYDLFHYVPSQSELRWSHRV